MKKLITILAIAIISLGCSKDDDNEIIVETTDVECYICTMFNGERYGTTPEFCRDRQGLEDYKIMLRNEGFTNIQCSKVQR